MLNLLLEIVSNSGFHLTFQQPMIAVSLVMPINKRKEDEMSVGSAPLAKQQSCQASEYASSPIKTRTMTGMCQELYKVYDFILPLS